MGNVRDRALQARGLPCHGPRETRTQRNRMKGRATGVEEAGRKGPSRSLIVSDR